MHLGSPETVNMASHIRNSQPIKALPLTSPPQEPRKTLESESAPSTNFLSNSPNTPIRVIPLTSPPSQARRPSQPALSSSPPEPFTLPPASTSITTDMSADTTAPSPNDSVTAASSKQRAELLFNPSLISNDLQKKLPEGYSIRPLARTDYAAGMLEVLKVLTTVGDISEAAWLERFDYMKKREGDYYQLVVENASGRIVGTGALLAERKFIHNLGMVGHIEDIAVATDQQGKKLGLRIIETLDHIAKSIGCYKAILDCSEKNEGFYLKCGYSRAGLEMAHYY